jgi:hypothetical protein
MYYWQDVVGDDSKGGWDVDGIYGDLGDTQRSGSVMLSEIGITMG